MSLVPDMRPDSFLEIPANTQRDLYDALRGLSALRPDFVRYTGHQTSRWEQNFEITPAGAAFLSELIINAQIPTGKFQSIVQQDESN